MHNAAAAAAAAAIELLLAFFFSLSALFVCCAMSTSWTPADAEYSVCTEYTLYFGCLLCPFMVGCSAVRASTAVWYFGVSSPLGIKS